MAETQISIVPQESTDEETATILGLFDAKTMGKGLRECEWGITEELRILIGIAQDDEEIGQVRMAALKRIRHLAKENAILSGLMQTVDLERRSTGEGGEQLIASARVTKVTAAATQNTMAALEAGMNTEKTLDFQGEQDATGQGLENGDRGDNGESAATGCSGETGGSQEESRGGRQVTCWDPEEERRAREAGLYDDPLPEEAEDSGDGKLDVHGEEEEGEEGKQGSRGDDEGREVGEDETILTDPLGYRRPEQDPAGGGLGAYTTQPDD